MCTKFEVDWNSTLSKTTLFKNFNLKLDRRTNKRMQTEKRNAHKWGIKVTLHSSYNGGGADGNTDSSICDGATSLDVGIMGAHG